MEILCIISCLVVGVWLIWDAVHVRRHRAAIEQEVNALCRAMMATPTPEQRNAAIDRISPPVDWPTRHVDTDVALPVLPIGPRLTNHPPTLPQREDWHLPPVTSATPEERQLPQQPPSPIDGHKTLQRAVGDMRHEEPIHVDG